jgi:cellulose synthase/poly-beta-1,6-N-acetylglucosamine synthase-like glycosyltransferase
MNIFTILLWIGFFIALYLIVFWLLVFLSRWKKEERKKVKEKPLVTVVIPAYNEEKEIKRTIDSVLHLNYPKDKIELMVLFISFSSL